MNEHEQKYIELQKRIDAYLAGTLSQQEVDELWADLISDPDYYEYFETNIYLRKLYSDYRSSTSPQGSDARSASTVIHKLSDRWHWYVAAASILILLGISVLTLNHRASLKKLSVKEINSNNIESPDIMRSDSGKTKKSDSLLNLGYHATITGNISRAEEIYTNIINNYNDRSSNIMAHLNLGILKYNNKEFRLAKEHFSTVIKKTKQQEDRRLQEKAYWYLGNTYLSLEEKQKAKEAIHKAWSANGVYRKPAERLLEEMDYEFSSAD